MSVNDSASEDSEECEGEPGKHMLSVLENTYVIINRQLVEIRMLKALLVKAQMEMKNMSLESEGERILVI